MQGLCCVFAFRRPAVCVHAQQSPGERDILALETQEPAATSMLPMNLKGPSAHRQLAKKTER
jgi:hypothetical protein